MPLFLYNTLSKKEEQFESIEPKKVKMYTCGPTVYGRPHIGNYSSFLMADLLKRWLNVCGFTVTHVKNITDVGHLIADRDEGEDKIELQAKREKIDPLTIAAKYTSQYLEDEKALNILEPSSRPRATETIPEMIAIIEKLVASGHAYETEDGVYFSVSTFPEYGKLSGNTLENLESGARVAVDENKRHPADFALWKKTVGPNADHVLRWPSPWGEGFPGWHIECSAMAKKHLGEQIDIHTGGEDNIFPHHECEIAQSESTGKQPFSRFWLHKRRIDMGEAKMSKSLGNVLTIPDIINKGFDPLDLRYLFLSVHYRTRLKFTWKGMEDARKARRKVIDWIAEVPALPLTVREETAAPEAEVWAWQAKFTDAMNGDLNTPAALAAVFECMAWSRNQSFTRDSLDALLSFTSIIRQTFGCFERAEEELPQKVRELMKLRDQARANKDFDESDRLRDAILSLGYQVKDTSDGQKAVRK